MLYGVSNLEERQQEMPPFSMRADGGAPSDPNQPSWWTGTMFLRVNSAVMEPKATWGESVSLAYIS